MNRSKSFGKILVVIGIILILAFFLYRILGNKGGKIVDPNIDRSSLDNVDTPDPTIRGNGTSSTETGTSIDPNVGFTDENEQKLPDLIQITDYPVTGATAYNEIDVVTKTISTTVVEISPVTGNRSLVPVTREVQEFIPVPVIRYNEYSTGILRETTLHPLEGVAERTLTNRKIPQAGEILFSNKENRVLYRIYSDSNGVYQTFSGRLQGPLDDVKCSYVIPETINTQSDGVAVRILQNALRDLGYIVKPTQAGVYDEALTQAVQDFQGKNTLAVTGLVDTETSALLSNFCTQQELAKRKDELAKSSQKISYVLNGTFLPDGIIGIALNPSQTKLFYLKQERNLSSTGYISNIDGSNPQKVFSYPFSEWLVSWPNEKYILFTEKASGSVPSYAYLYDLVTRKLDRVTGGVEGTTTLPDATRTRLLVGSTKGISFTTNIYNYTDYTSTNLTIQTLPEKCTWNPDGTYLFCGVPQLIPSGVYPDSWYQGVSIFNDNLFFFNTTTKEVTELDTNLPFLDVMRPVLIEDIPWLLFIDRKTGFLWARRVSSQYVHPYTLKAPPTAIIEEETSTQ